MTDTDTTEGKGGEAVRGSAFTRQQVEEWAGTRISPTDQRHVLLALAHVCDLDTLEARISEARIAALINVSPARVPLIIRDLIRRKLVIRERRLIGGRAGIVYTLIPKAAEEEQDAITEATERMVAELRRQNESASVWSNFDSALDGLVEWDGTLDLRALAAAALTTEDS